MKNGETFGEIKIRVKVKEPTIFSEGNLPKPFTRGFKKIRPLRVWTYPTGDVEYVSQKEYEKRLKEGC